MHRQNGHEHRDPLGDVALERPVEQENQIREEIFERCVIDQQITRILNEEEILF